MAILLGKRILAFFLISLYLSMLICGTSTEHHFTKSKIEIFGDFWQNCQFFKKFPWKEFKCWRPRLLDSTIHIHILIHIKTELAKRNKIVDFRGG